MSKKIVVILEILAVLVAFVLYGVFVVVPEYKNKLGSSDYFIKSKEYSNMIEFSIDDNVNFSLLLNKKKQVYHIFFFDANAKCLYNQNIENNSYDEALSMVISKLIESDYLKVDSKIKMVRYGESDYMEFKKIFSSILLKYSISSPIIEDTSSLNDKAVVLEIESENQDMILYMMDLYSKEIIKDSNV